MGINIEFRDDEANDKLDAVLTILNSIIINQEQTMALNFEHLQAEVAAIRDARDSVLAVLAAYAQEIRDNSSDQAAINAIADQLDEIGGSIADAVVAVPAADPTDGAPVADPGLPPLEPDVVVGEPHPSPEGPQEAPPTPDTAPPADAEPPAPVEGDPTPPADAEPVVDGETPVDPAPVVEGETPVDPAPVVEG